METQFAIHRLPKHLQPTMRSLYRTNVPLPQSEEYLEENKIYCGDAANLLNQVTPNSVAVSVWSPPYFVGKSYEKNISFGEWKKMLQTVISLHFPIVKPGGFLAINIADILCFKDETMPKIQADVVRGKRVAINRDDILAVLKTRPDMNRYELAQYFSCSEQTIDRRFNGNNVRGGKHEPQTRVKIIGGLLEDWALKSGFYPYDRRIWVKDAAWENSRWSNTSYKAVDEYEYIYFFWKPGITTYDRARLTKDEWRNWGSRSVWMFPSVRANNDHEAKFPLELPLRIIKLFSEKDDVVLDCFMGSGTTAIAALQLERKYIGIELMSDYVKLAEKNIEKFKKK
jgi:site-specific DNA-methyltransferase (adenine-specific)